MLRACASSDACGAVSRPVGFRSVTAAPRRPPPLPAGAAAVPSALAQSCQAYTYRRKRRRRRRRRPRYYRPPVPIAACACICACKHGRARVRVRGSDERACDASPTRQKGQSGAHAMAHMSRRRRVRSALEAAGLSLSTPAGEGSDRAVPMADTGMPCPCTPTHSTSRTHPHARGHTKHTRAK